MVIRSVRQQHHSFIAGLPKDFCLHLGWKHKDKIDIELVGDTLVLKKADTPNAGSKETQ